MKVWKSEKYEDFVCPVCGSRDYRTLEVRYTSLFSSNRRVLKCGCKGCTVIFKDPERFTNAKKLNNKE